MVYMYKYINILQHEFYNTEYFIIIIIKKKIAFLDVTILYW